MAPMAQGPVSHGANGSPMTHFLTFVAGRLWRLISIRTVLRPLSGLKTDVTLIIFLTILVRTWRASGHGLNRKGS